MTLQRLNLLVVLAIGGVWAAVYVLGPQYERLSARDRLTMLTVHASVFACIGAVIALEGATERYGAPGFLTAYLSESQLRNVADVAQLVIATSASVAVLARSVNRSARSAVARWHGRVWLPYLGAWATATVFGRYMGTSSAAWMSVAAFLPIGLLVAGSTRLSLVRPTSLALRSIIGISLTLALLAPHRVWAPAGVWSGGWRPEMPRLQGFFPQPNTLGWVAAVAILFELRGPRVRFRYAAIALAALALSLSGSRSPLAALIVALVVSGSGSREQAARRPRHSWVQRGALALAATLVVGQLLRTATNLGSVNGRTQTWADAWGVFTANPLTGSGPGAYLSAVTVRDAVPYAHNQVLHTAAELGFVGVLALFLHVVALVRLVRLSPRRQLAASSVALWLTMFVSENLLRFTELAFTLQLLVFALVLQVALSAGPPPCPIVKADPQRVAPRMAATSASSNPAVYPGPRADRLSIGTGKIG